MKNESAYQIKNFELEEVGEILPVRVPTTWDYAADIVIVGGGGSGLSAAVAALRNNASVIVLEREPKTGGLSQHAGAAAAFNTKQAIRKRLKANLSKAFRHSYVIQSNATVDPKLLRTLIDRSHEIYDWSEEESWGRNWNAMTLGFIPDQGVARMVVKGTLKSAFISGTEFLAMMYPWMQWLKDHVLEKGGQILTNTEVKTLVKDGNSVVGVQCNTLDGKSLHIKANKGVILAGGGFSNNRSMLKKYCPGIYEKAVGTMVPPIDTGEVFRMALGAGADMAGKDSWVAFAGGIPFFDTKYTGKAEPGPWSQYLRQGWLQLSRGGGWLEINKACEEYVPDMVHADYEMHPKATASLPGSAAYVIFDSNFPKTIWETLPPPMLDDRPMTEEDPEYAWFNEFRDFQPKNWLVSVENAIKMGGIKKSDSIEGLAQELGLEPKLLVAAVNKWNIKSDAGKVDEFGRLPQNMKPIVKGPFYGIKTGAVISAMYCGARVNYKFEVLDKKHNPIPGLYAVGLTAGGTNGEGVIQASSLSAVGLAYASGWIAGDNATTSEPLYTPKEMVIESEIGAQAMLGKVNKNFPKVGAFVMKIAFGGNKHK